MQMYPDIMQVVVLEVGERAKMKHNQDGHDLTIGKGGVTMSTADSVLKIVSPTFPIMIVSSSRLTPPNNPVAEGGGRGNAVMD